MTEPVKEEHLEHYGIRGMKWGVRRRISSSGRVVKGSTDYKTTVPLRRKPVQSLSNMQLKKVNERMQLEEKFSKMNPSRRERGKRVLNDVLKTTIGVGGTAAAVKIASDPKTMELIKKGADILKYKMSKEGQMLRLIRKGKFGG